MADLYLDLLLAVPTTAGLYTDPLAVPSTGPYADTGATPSPSNGRATERVAVFDDLSMNGRANDAVAGMAVTGMAAEVYVDTTSAVAPLRAGRFAGAVMSYVEFMAHYAVLAGLCAGLLAVRTTGDLLDGLFVLAGLDAVLKAGDAVDGRVASVVAVITVGHAVDDLILFLLPLLLRGGYARFSLAGLAHGLGATCHRGGWWRRSHR
jgi:hypothetical protein